MIAQMKKAQKDTLNSIQIWEADTDEQNKVKVAKWSNNQMNILPGPDFFGAFQV